MGSIQPTIESASWPTGLEIIYPETPSFKTATARWSAYKSPSYSAAVIPSSEEEVASIVKTATTSNIPFLATGGRHHYGTTVNKLQNGLAIDLSKFNSVVVDRENATVTVGGGAKIRDVLAKVGEAGFQIPSGGCNGVGFVGSALGGGVGYLEGTLGLVIDALLSARLVTASGETIDVSKSSHADLFWGLRGAGTNFGIVTSAVFKLTPAVNNGGVFYTDLIFNATQKKAYFEALEAMEGLMSPKLGFITAVFWNVEVDETGIVTTFIYAGPEAEAREQLAPFFDIGPVVFATKMISFTQIPTVTMMGIPDMWCEAKDGLHSIHALNVRRFDAATYCAVFDKFDNFMREYPDSRTSTLLLETFGNAKTLEVADEETAYPWRDARGNHMLQFRWTGMENPFGETANAFAKELRAELVATSGYPDLSVYVSYAFGDETLEQKFGKDKLPRLVELKRKWDPDNVFGFCNPLPTEL